MRILFLVAVLTPGLPLSATETDAVDRFNNWASSFAVIDILICPSHDMIKLIRQLLGEKYQKHN